MGLEQGELLDMDILILIKQGSMPTLVKSNCTLVEPIRQQDQIVNNI